MSTSIPPSRHPVIVIGSGLAGLSASYEAIQRGASVQLLDRAPKCGGNSIKASSGINGDGTRFQKALGIDHDGLLYADTIKSAGGRFSAQEVPPSPVVDREALIKMMTESSAEAVTWLVDDVGVDLSVVAPLGGHSVARTHRPAGNMPPGAAIISGLLEKLQKSDHFSVTNGADVRKLLTDKEFASAEAKEEKPPVSVRGVEYVENGNVQQLEGKVIFATGGFAGDASGLLSRYRPDLRGMPSTNDERPGSHDILSAVGAELVDMDSIQIHPTGFIDPAAPDSMRKFLAAEMLRGEGGILLSPSGHRFVNELETREHVSDAIMKLPPREEENQMSINDGSHIKQWNITLVLDPGASTAAASHIGFYEWKGLLRRVKIRDLDASVIASIDKYSHAVADGLPDEFGRRTYGRWSLKSCQESGDQVVYVGNITPIVHFTMGGVAIDEHARALRLRNGRLEAIPGLLAAGEITGGIHGDNRLGGSSLLECVVFGRTAGAQSAL